MTVTPATDDLSDVLERLRWSVGGYRKETLRGSERRVVGGTGMRFHFVAEGGLDVRGTANTRLGTGDFLLLPRGGEHTLIARGGTVLHTGDLEAASPNAGRVAAVMPEMLIACCLSVREPVVAAVIDGMAFEACGDRPGSRSVVSQLANVLTAAAIRRWVESDCGSLPLLTVPLRDAEVGRALEAIHEAPGSPWTVETLARVALASRSAFAKRFRDVVGESPARYLARIRMEQAKRLLTDRTSVAEVAVRLGYGSEAAFSRAFRRNAGVPPTQWRQGDNGWSAPPA
ncbi:AraC family transcriptional regulator [Asanoa sp. WMMD1127]|uniref:helix-turn-helix transcriptional regulator n=1 Tax=Asanoa sp. WMMD1127 TaxID=3016107 RepID=UPI002417631B|nr:AraC family transcriptional regulator [Asanoa sp. WMMD1127]MDG4826621.1 AraC family transcriptional regulator [Asanoa sp. WMMD1127]